MARSSAAADSGELSTGTRISRYSTIPPDPRHGVSDTARAIPLGSAAMGTSMSASKLAARGRDQRRRGPAIRSRASRKGGVRPSNLYRLLPTGPAGPNMMLRQSRDCIRREAVVPGGTPVCRVYDAPGTLVNDSGDGESATILQIETGAREHREVDDDEDERGEVEGRRDDGSVHARVRAREEGALDEGR